MLNIFTKTKSWMVASLFVGASVFGQSAEPKPSCQPAKPVCPPKPCCAPVPKIQLIPAYNAPARVDVRGCWDLYFGASFIYWEAMQDNMAFAASATSNQTTSFATSGPNKTTGALIGQDFTYKPGFKVLAGMNFDHDNWDGYAEYTWFKTSTKSSVTAAPVSASPGVGIQSAGVYPVNGCPALIEQMVFANTGSQDWHLDFQSLDTALARSYYVGTKLTFRSIFGARFAWFTQKKEQEFFSDGSLSGSNPGQATLTQSFSSWGAGLLMGLHTNWILAEGFRIIGNGSFDMLYTRVQSTNYKQHWVPKGDFGQTWNFPQDRPDFVMPHADLEFGFGWSTYFDCNNWHVDLLATYGFQTFWGANLFRQFGDDVQTASSIMPSGNLYIHGLTVSARLDF